MKPKHHPDTTHFIASILVSIREGCPLLHVLCRDQKELNLIRNTVNAGMEELGMSPRLKTLNLIGWGLTQIWFSVVEQFHGCNMEAASVFVSPEAVDAGLPPELERALTGGESLPAPV